MKPYMKFFGIKNFIQIIKQFTFILIISFMMINNSWAMSDPDESAKQALRKKQEHLEDQIDNLASALNPQSPLLPSAIPRARRTMLDARSCLDKNRLIWYTTFASAGSALAISNAFDINDPGGYTPFILGGIATGLVVGGGAGYMINKYYPGATECMHNTCVNVSAGLLSVVPWIIFGVTKNKNNP